MSPGKIKQLEKPRYVRYLGYFETGKMFPFLLTATTLHGGDSHRVTEVTDIPDFS